MGAGRQPVTGSPRLEAVGASRLHQIGSCRKDRRASLLMLIIVISSAAVINPEAPCRAVYFQEADAGHLGEVNILSLSL